MRGEPLFGPRPVRKAASPSYAAYSAMWTMLTYGGLKKICVLEAAARKGGPARR